MCLICILYGWVFIFLNMNEIQHKIIAFNLIMSLNPCFHTLTGLPSKAILQALILTQSPPAPPGLAFQQVKFSSLFLFLHYRGVMSHTDWTQTLTLELNLKRKSDSPVHLAACGNTKEKSPGLHSHVGNISSVREPASFLRRTQVPWTLLLCIEVNVYVYQLGHFGLGLTECSPKGGLNSEGLFVSLNEKSKARQL